ncbi:MAG: response regulator [Bacteroidota bacterium]
MAPRKYRIVMLVDDSEIDNLINQKMIESADLADIIFTHSGARSAIEYLRNVEKVADPAAVLPDVLFLDIDMPLMDGFQFLDEFEKLKPTTKAGIRIVMLTSSVNPQDLDQSKKYPSVQLFLNKPLSQRSLLQMAV